MTHTTLERVRELSDEIGKRADEIERERQLPTGIVDALGAAGCFRMMAPQRLGGDQLRMSAALPVLSELARADPSTGWIVGQVALSQLIISCCPDAAVDEAYTDGPDLLAAGAVAPKGRAAATPDGWRVSGQWTFVTGCTRASWFYLNCVAMSGRNLDVSADGIPATRIMLLPAPAVTIEDTWHTMGLRGTGSHDVRVGGAVVPDHRSFTLGPDNPAAAAAAARIAYSSLIIAAVAVGIADGALADIIELATGGKRPALSRQRLSRSPLFQDRLGEAHMRLRAAQSLLATQAADADAAMASPTGRQRAELRATAAQVTAVASQVVDAAYTLGGGTSLFDSSPLQRRLRDMRTATQHFVAGRQSFGALGALLVGEEPDTGAF